MVLSAVKQDERALRYASIELREDKEIMLTAVKENASACNYILKGSRVFSSAIKQEDEVFCFLVGIIEIII